MTPAIQTSGLRKRFGAKLAVADLSLSVRRGEVFGFLGPNGAGKTTSLKMLLGLVPPTAGRATLLGAPVGDRKARARVGFLPEHFRFQDWLTGRELLGFHGRLFGIPRRTLSPRVEALLERVRLTEAADRPVRTYSKGMLQRVGLAQALVNEPELVFLDEPTSGLDPLGRLLVRDIIHEQRARGTTVFLNSHLLGEVEVTCDRVVFIKAGRTLHEMVLADTQAATEVELRLGPLDPETRAGLDRFGECLTDGVAPATVPPVAPPVATTSDAPGAPPAPERPLRMRVTSEAVLPEIARWLVGRGVALYEMRAARKSLEAWFLEAMGDDQAPGRAMRRLIVIVHLTLHEAMRRRVLLAAMLGGAAFLILYAVGFTFIARDLAKESLVERRVALNAITLAGMFAVNLLTVMSAVLLPVDALSGEIASGSIQTLASKPMRRSEIVLGKWLAYALVVIGYLGMMAGGVLLIARVIGGFSLPAAGAGLPLMVLEVVLLVSVSIAGGTRLSTVTNGMAAFGLYGLAFVGNWVEQIGTFVNNTAARNVGTVASLIMPAEAMWQRAAWLMQPAIMRDLNATPFSPASVASPAMVGWAALYTVATLLVAVWGFRRRGL